MKINNKKREEALKYLNDFKTFDKYKKISQELVKKEAKLLQLQEQEVKLIKYNKLKSDKEEIKDDLEKNDLLLKENLKANKDKNSIYSLIKLKFNSIIKILLNKEALITINMNGEGNLDFNEEILDKEGSQTSESDGKTYKKLLCIAFDLAVNQVHLTKDFTHFSFHDGFLENLDDRKKEKFINLLREFTDSGYQYIGTLIDSDLKNQDKTIFNEDEIILLLHDDENGTLFKMPSW